MLTLLNEQTEANVRTSFYPKQVVQPKTTNQTPNSQTLYTDGAPLTTQPYLPKTIMYPKYKENISSNKLKQKNFKQYKTKPT